MSLIEYANEYRRIAKDPAALAGLSLIHIMKERAAITGSNQEPALGWAFIVRQFKRPEEIELMRRVYGRKFITVAPRVALADNRNQIGLRLVVNIRPSLRAKPVLAYPALGEKGVALRSAHRLKQAERAGTACWEHFRSSGI